MLNANMLDTIRAYLEQHHLLPEQGTVVVAVSGGADSLCLLHLLHEVCGPSKPYPAVQLHVAHLNHQLRGQESERDATVVAQLAHSWDLPVTIGSIDVSALARQEQRSLEDAARVARYRFLREVAQDQLIAVAHHQDDQVETLLLHCLRGGGLASMVGLQPRQQDIIRPLLCVTRADTLAYCEQHHLVPLEDASNSDPRFLRNRIRHELLPLLTELNPGIRETR
jgi:tRNA(Ile)-lysidine synthase